MATIQSGVFDNPRGSVGGVTFSGWKGIGTIRKKPTSVANPQTAAQIAQRDKMTGVVAFARQVLATMIVALMNRFAKKMTGYNMFVSLNIAQFTDILTVSWANISFGSGLLGDTPITSATLDQSAASVNVDWDAVSYGSYQQDTDKAYLCIVDTTTAEVIFSGDTGAIRDDGNYNATSLSGIVAGRNYAMYLVFLRDNGTIVGNTAYLNVLAVA